MNIRNRLLTLAAIALVAWSPGAQAQKKLTIGISTLSLKFPYAAAISRGQHKAAAELGVDLVELDANVDLLKQANDVDDLIARGVDGIVIVPLDGRTAMGWVTAAKAAGIPIISDDVWVGDPKSQKMPWVDPDLTAWVGRNDLAVASLLGEVAAKKIPDGAKIGIVEGLPGFAESIYRTEGFLTALDKSGKKYEIAATQPANFDPELAHTVCQTMLAAHGDIGLFFAHSADMGLGCRIAVQEAGSKAEIVTIDSSKQIIERIAAGEPITTICSQPETMGYNAVKAMVEHLRGTKKLSASFITYNWFAVTRDNVADCPPQH